MDAALVDVRVDAGVAEGEDAAAADRITDLCDQVAFDFCLERPASGVVAVSGHDGGSVALAYEVDGEGDVALDPWPLRPGTVTGIVLGYAAEGYPGRLDRSSRRSTGSGMRALILHGPGDLRLEEVPEPVVGEGDVLLQVEVALTDGTDLKAYRRGHPFLLGPLPSPFGHESCGIDVASGRRVVVANSRPAAPVPPARGDR